MADLRCRAAVYEHPDSNVSNAGRTTEVTSGFDLRGYAETRRKGHLKPGAAHLLISITDVEAAKGRHWQGYQYTFTQGYSSSEPGFVTTHLFVTNDGMLYRISYDNNDPLQTTIVGTLRFVEQEGT